MSEDTFRQCEVCEGSGKLRLLGGMLMDTRLKENYHQDRCGICGGTGRRLKRAEVLRDYAKGQARMRAMYKAAE